MNRLLALALVLSFTVALVSGCSTHHPVELRPYSAGESHELALEDLNRRGLSFEEYQIRKAQLLADPQIQQVRSFDSQAETSVDRSDMSQNPQG